jgi:hypothetical protein
MPGGVGGVAPRGVPLSRSSFLSADKRKTYCLYEAPNAEAIRAAARRLGVPADTIVEVGAEVGPYAAAIAPLREQVGTNPDPSG